MTLLTGLRTGIKLAGRIDRKYNINKIFVDKYVPPGYRKLTRQIFDAAGFIGGGYGLYNVIQSLYAPDTPGNSGQTVFQKRQQYTPRKSYQTRRRSTNRYGPECPKYKRTNRY